jgi:hypothetical protein
LTKSGRIEKYSEWAYGGLEGRERATTMKMGDLEELEDQIDGNALPVLDELV